MKTISLWFWILIRVLPRKKTQPGGGGGRDLLRANGMCIYRVRSEGSLGCTPPGNFEILRNAKYGAF